MENRFDKFKADADKLLATAEAMHTDGLLNRHFERSKTR